MDYRAATGIRRLTLQRHAEGIARGQATRRLSVIPDVRPPIVPGRAARFLAAALLAAALGLGFAGHGAAERSPADPAPLRGYLRYAPRHDRPALAFPRRLPRPLPVPPDRLAK